MLDYQPPVPRPQYQPKIQSTGQWFHIDEYAEHPAARYAVSRGYVPELRRFMMIDDVANAIVFLVRDEQDRVVGWQKRFVNPTDPKFKTLNPPGSEFKKSQHLLEIPQKGDLCVVEGPATAFGAYHFGLHALCTFGALISARQLDMVYQAARRTGKRVAVGYDCDFAGVLGYYKIKNYLNRRGVEVYRIRPESGNDLNDAWKDGKRYQVVDVEDDDSTVPPLEGELFEEFYN